ncbi:hypothetical protein Bcen2424_3838 [Burkholderia cenocepacia HI2424]|nr:hypothetical protein Bcen2424_3838 [Burkholderia cenocepacia HI2424]
MLRACISPLLPTIDENQPEPVARAPACPADRLRAHAPPPLVMRAPRRSPSPCASTGAALRARRRSSPVAHGARHRDNTHLAAGLPHRYTVHGNVDLRRDSCEGGFYSDGNTANMSVRSCPSYAAASRRAIPTPSGEQRWLQGHPTQTGRRRPR